MLFEPEVRNGDPLFKLIVDSIKINKPESILEIGSANGLGSTQAFIKGIKESEIIEKCTLYCIEAEFNRFYELSANTEPYKFIVNINASSVPLNQYMTPDDIDNFMSNHNTEFNIIKYFNPETVKQWLRDEIEMIKNNNISLKGIHRAIELNRSDVFDIVFIDGSAFTGVADFKKIYGSNLIIMDDVLDIKCWEPMRLLDGDKSYNVIEKNFNYRNGYAAFRLIRS